MKSQSLNQTPQALFPIGDLARIGAAKFGQTTAFWHFSAGSWRSISYTELDSLTANLARWLVDSGLKPGDRAAVTGENSPEWSLAFLAILIAGGVVVPIDNSLPPSGVRYILNDSEARFLFASRKQLSALMDAPPEAADLRLVNLSPTTLPGSILLNEAVTTGHESGAALPEIDLESLASILYTSGTTGHSKGVMLSHRNIMSNVFAASSLIPIVTGDVFLSVLPVHHSLECTAGFLLPLFNGSSIAYARSMKSIDLIKDIKERQVTVMIGVPLLFEKFNAGIIKGLEKKPASIRLLFRLLMGISRVAGMVGIDAGKTLFQGIRERAGLGSLRFFVSGGGPLDPKVGNFFLRFGIKLLQGYGMTETSPITHVNPPSRIKVETVGLPLRDVECRIAESDPNGVGEVEIRGPNVFMGYYRNTEATADALTSDGWLRTGDLGRIDPDGYLQLMGRKKNLIVTGGGKNIYPEEIEFSLNRQRFIADSLVLGYKRASGYGEEVGALVQPDMEQIEMLTAERGGVTQTEKELFRLIQEDINRAVQELAEYKRVRRFKIMTDGFERTSSRKIKRFLYSGDVFKSE